MALEYTIYGPPPRSFGALIPIPGDELITGQITVGASSAHSPVAPAGCYLVVVQPNEDCRIKIGLSAVAANHRLIRAGNEYAFAIREGERIAVIAET